ncbi:MAG: hypothetical protein ACYDAG_13905 [Chloroflexota bacterium]
MRSPEELDARPSHARGVTELAVDLTVAWLKRVESTADGRDPREVVQALDEFFKAIQRNRETERQAEGARGADGAAAGAAVYQPPAAVHPGS